MKESGKIGVAIVGYGYWGPNQVRVFTESPDAEMLLLCDKSAARRASAQRRYPALSVTGRFEDVLEDRRIRAVVIATPVSTHFDLARRALEAGKHVLVEKPLATSSREAAALIKLAKKNGLTLMVGHTFIYSPPVLKVKQLLEQKALGEVFHMDFSRVNLGLFQPDVNVLWDLGPHDVSIALYWLGRLPISVRAEARSFVRKNIEEVGYVSMEFPGGVLVHNHVSWLAPVKLRRVSITGSKKMLVYDDTASAEKVKIYDQGVLKNPKTFGEFQLTYRSGDILSPKIDSSEPLALQCADFVESIRTGRKPRSGGDFGLQVVRVIEAAQLSLKRGGASVRVAGR
ncbi:MAG: Gfo/Idh/MocA family oxidoreductase [Elusimicrobia bacterium]|nr:Gfo/Idh/MocA family oxidoreductase [Elusimicrobiota bacterium]